MLKVLFWLLLDSFFIFSLVKLYDEMGGFIFLFIVAILFFTWELFNAIKKLFE